MGVGTRVLMPSYNERGESVFVFSEDSLAESSARMFIEVVRANNLKLCYILMILYPEAVV